MFNGTAGNDTFLAPLVDGASSLNAFDQIAGGQGTDTLRVEGAQAIAGDITSVERVFVEGAAGNGSASTAYDATAVGGLQQFWFQNNSSATTAIGNLAEGQAVGIKGLAASTSTTATYSAGVTAGTIAVDGARSADVDGRSPFNVAVNGPNVNTVTIAGSTAQTSTYYGELNLSSTATVTALNLVADGGPLNVQAKSEDTIKEVNVTSAAGVETVVSVDNAELTYVGGEGDDTLNLEDAANNLTTDFSFDGGEGTDTLQLTVEVGTNTSSTIGGVTFDGSGNVSFTDTAYNILNAQNAEVVAFNLGSATNQAVTVDMAELDAEQAAFRDNAGVNNIEATDTIIASGVNTVALQALENTAGDDFDADSEGEVNLVAESGTVTVAANSDTATTSNFATLNLSGEGNVTFNNSTLGNASTVDASELEGDLMFTGGTAIEKVTLGAGDDTLVYTTGTSSTYAATDTITGFDASADTINVTGSGGELVEFDAEGLTYENALVSAAESVAGASAGDGVDVAWFTLGGDTYLVQDTGTASATDNENGDFVLKLAGVVDLTADNFDFAA